MSEPLPSIADKVELIRLYLIWHELEELVEFWDNFIKSDRVEVWKVITALYLAMKSNKEIIEQTEEKYLDIILDAIKHEEKLLPYL